MIFVLTIGRTFDQHCRFLLPSRTKESKLLRASMHSKKSTSWTYLLLNGQHHKRESYRWGYAILNDVSRCLSHPNSFLHVTDCAKLTEKTHLSRVQLWSGRNVVAFGVWCAPVIQQIPTQDAHLGFITNQSHARDRNTFKSWHWYTDNIN